VTYDDLMALARQGDPLIDPARPDSASITPEGLLILGTSEGGYQADMLIRIEPEGKLRAWLRDPPGGLEGEPYHGSEWAEESVFDEYDDLCSWAYAW
jgi:hypothetical protein